MKINKLFCGILTIASLHCVNGFAESYELTCSDYYGIFEQPLNIKINGTVASASAEWSGAGDALFTAKYKRLYTLDVKTSGNDLESLTISEPHVVEQTNGFQLSLSRSSETELKGHITMVSTDHDQMTYDGNVTCKIKN